MRSKPSLSIKPSNGGFLLKRPFGQIGKVVKKRIGKVVKKRTRKVLKSLDKKQMERTTLGLREVLFDEIDLLRAGLTNHQKVNALAKSASAIIGTVRLEMDYKKMLLNYSKKNNSSAILSSSGLMLGKQI